MKKYKETKLMLLIYIPLILFLILSFMQEKGHLAGIIIFFMIIHINNVISAYEIDIWRNKLL